MLKSRWLQIFASGLVLLYLVGRALAATANPGYVPSVILLGAFLVPVTFVTYLYERLPRWEVPFPAMAVCFLWGGVLGTVVAGALEYKVARKLGFLPYVLIGLIEESAKMIVPLVFYALGRYRSQGAGIVIGLATAAGFAGLETMGYAFVVLLESRGDLADLYQLLFLRGLTAPAGHIAWTALVCAVLWRERLRAGRATVNGQVIAAFVIAVILHSLWNVFAGIESRALGARLIVEALSIAVPVASLLLLARRVSEARRS